MHRNVSIVVVGDKGSPPDTASYLSSLQCRGLEIIYLGIEEQRVFLRKFPRFSNFLPVNSVQRRNVGYLFAARKGADVVISMDDDNFPLEEFDYLGEHGIVGEIQDCKEISCSTGWFNSCSLLETRPGRRFYHRGFPLNKRWLRENLSFGTCRKKIAVNIGLWIGSPDVDTITRLEEPFEVTGIRDATSRMVVAENTMTPFNTQNTAFLIDLLPCMYLISFDRKSEMLKGNNNFRYDDIWMSYFSKKIIDHMGDAVSIGPPHVRQVRNEHDYLLDLHKELLPMKMTVPLTEILDGVKFVGNSYFECYAELIEFLDKEISSSVRFNRDERKHLKRMTYGMNLWLEVVSSVMNHRS